MRDFGFFSGYFEDVERVATNDESLSFWRPPLKYEIRWPDPEEFGVLTISGQNLGHPLLSPVSEWPHNYADTLAMLRRDGWEATDELYLEDVEK